MKVKPDYKIAHAAGWDAGNRNAKKHGRKRWSKADWNVAAKTFNKVFLALEVKLRDYPLETRNRP